MSFCDPYCEHYKNPEDNDRVELESDYDDILLSHFFGVL